MPIYEYKCSACGHQEDHLQKLSERPLTKCPACGKKKYAKQLTAAGFQLKGSGWYATDYGKGNAGTKPAESKAEAGDKAEQKSEKEKKDSGSTSTETKSTATESKPAPPNKTA